MVEAVVLVNTDFESPQDQLLEDLKEINGVNKAYTTAYSVYDFVDRVQTKTVNELKNRVLERIRKINAVISITTLVVSRKSLWRRKD